MMCVCARTRARVHKHTKRERETRARVRHSEHVVRAQRAKEGPAGADRLAVGHAAARGGRRPVAVRRVPPLRTLRSLSRFISGPSGPSGVLAALSAAQRSEPLHQRHVRHEPRIRGEKACCWARCAPSAAHTRSLVPKPETPKPETPHPKPYSLNPALYVELAVAVAALSHGPL